MKRKVLAFLHNLMHGLNRAKLLFERAYIRSAYRHVVNDLVINNKEQYDPFGTYVTLRDVPPSNYRTQVRAFNCDKNGIRRFAVMNRNNKEEYVYNSIHIAQQGLTEYGYYLRDGKKERLEIMQNVADWFVETQDKKTGAWINHFDLYNHNVSSWLIDPWISAMGEGQAISFLCRYYHLTKDEKYLEAAVRGLCIFHVNVEDGGVVSWFNGNPVYEEYPTKPESFTLNGFIYSLFGLYDLYVTANHEEALQLFNRGISTLEYILPLYDDSHITYYDLGYLTAPPRNPRQISKYHLIHIKLLQNLCSISDSKMISFYAAKWSKQ